jgi:hypothetical protein
MLSIGGWLVPPRSAAASSITITYPIKTWAPAGLPTAPSLESFAATQMADFLDLLWGIEYYEDFDTLLVDAVDSPFATITLDRDGVVLGVAQLIGVHWVQLTEQYEQLTDGASGLTSAATSTQWLVAAIAQASEFTADGDVYITATVPLLGMVVGGVMERSDGVQLEMRTMVPLDIMQDIPVYVAAAKELGAWMEAGTQDDDGVEIDCHMFEDGKSGAVSCDCGCLASYGGAMVECARELALKMLACGLLFIAVMVVIIAACPGTTPALFASCTAGAMKQNLRLLGACSAWAVWGFIDCSWAAGAASLACMKACP